MEVKILSRLLLEGEGGNISLIGGKEEGVKIHIKERAEGYIKREGGGRGETFFFSARPESLHNM